MKKKIQYIFLNAIPTLLMIGLIPIVKDDYLLAATYFFIILVSFAIKKEEKDFLIFAFTDKALSGRHGRIHRNIEACAFSRRQIKHWQAWYRHPCDCRQGRRGVLQYMDTWNFCKTAGGHTCRNADKVVERENETIRQTYQEIGNVSVIEALKWAYRKSRSFQATLYLYDKEAVLRHKKIIGSVVQK